MNKLHRLFAVAFAAFFIVSPVCAQNSGTVTANAFAVGQGPGTNGFASVLCTQAQIAIGQTAAKPICQSLTGDVTITAGGVTAIGANKVTNSQLNTMAANTTKCNATAGTANPTDCTASTMRTNMGVVIGTNVEAWDTDLDCLAGLSSTGVISRTGAGTCSAGALALSGLAVGTQDTVIGYWGSTTATAIAISNCTGALTYSTATHTFGCNASAGTGTVTSAQVSAGNGISVSGTCTITTTGNCAVAQSLTNATTQVVASALTTISSTSSVMGGLNSVVTCKITPVYSGRVMVWLNGQMSNSAGANNISVSMRYGTGAAPLANAAVTGTALGSSATSNLSASQSEPMPTLGGIITGLSVGTQVWFDVVESVTAGQSVQLTNLGCSVMEF